MARSLSVWRPFLVLPLAGAFAGALALAAPAPAQASARSDYERLLARAGSLRLDGPRPTPRPQMRRVAAEGEAVAKRHAASGYADNALWQAATISLAAHRVYRNAARSRPRPRDPRPARAPLSVQLARAAGARAAPAPRGRRGRVPLDAAIDAGACTRTRSRHTGGSRDPGRERHACPRVGVAHVHAGGTRDPAASRPSGACAAR